MSFKEIIMQYLVTDKDWIFAAVCAFLFGGLIADFIAAFLKKWQERRERAQERDGVSFSGF